MGLGTGTRLASRGLVLVTIVAALFATSVYGAAAPDFNVFIPFTGTAPDNCNGEVVETAGQFHVVVHTTMSPSGTVHFDSLDNFADLRGTGIPSGNKYTVTDTTHVDLNFDGPTMNVTVTEAHLVNSAGPTPNFFFHDLLHVTVNETGLGAFTDDLRFGCTQQP